MALTIKLVPGYNFAPNELLTSDKLNQLGNPVVSLEGTITGTTLGPASVSTSNLQDGILSADSVGRAKMADGYVTASKLAPGAVTAAALDPNALATAGPVVGSVRNLICTNGASNTKVSINADEAILENAGGGVFKAGPVSLTADGAASGVNGLDAASLTLNQWYYIWLIYNGSTVASLLSLSPTAPTLPGGYTHQALMGAVQTDASIHFLPFYQQDRRTYIGPVAILNNVLGVVTYQALSLGTLLPSIVKRISGTAGNNSAATRSMAIAMDASGMGELVLLCATPNNPNPASWSGFNVALPYSMGVKGNSIFWKGQDTGTSYRIVVTSYEF